VLATVDWNAIGQSVAGSLVAGIGITLAFAIGVRGLIRASELRGDGRTVMAGVCAAVGATGLLVAIAGAMVGLVIVAGGQPTG
jgi:hypothetical protein